MHPLLQPLIIDRVFDFLGVFDIHKCQYVCEAWRESALRILAKSTPIDKFHALAAGRYWYPDDNSGDLLNTYKRRNELIIMNRKMNQVEYNDNANLLHDWTHHWYIDSTNKSCLLPKFEADEAVKRYLTSDVSCIPRFSFILYSEKFQKIVENTPLRYPALLIRQGGTRYIDGILEKELDDKIESPFFIKESHPGLCLGSSMLYSYLNSFHINQYIPGVKITVTDWSDPQSPRPNANDSEFPVKSVVYLGNNTAFNFDRTDSIRKILKSFEPNCSGGVMEYGWREHDLPIFLNDPRKDTLIAASRTTITFAGKNVSSAVHRIKTWSNVGEKLEEFKQGLDFPTDDGHLIGFLFDLNLVFPEEFHRRILSLFPKIRLIRMVMRKLLEPVEAQSSDMILHLVRI